MQAQQVSSSTNLEWLDRGRVPCLDGLRAVSIAAVLLSHTSRTRGFPVVLTPLRVKLSMALGDLGVDVFFAVSGFLITLLLVREANTNGRISIKMFYVRRALRIIPVFIAYLLFVAFLSHYGVLRMRPSDWAHALTYTVNFASTPAGAIEHVWSLSIEEHFYLVWPLTLCLLGRKRALFALVGLLVAAPFLRLGVEYYGGLTQLHRATFMRMDTIAGGCVLALVLSSPRIRRKLTGVGARADFWAVLAAVTLIGMEGLFFAGPQWAKVAFRFSARTASICALILACLSRRDSRVAWFLNRRPLVLIGTLSYSLYLWQQPFLTDIAASARQFGGWPINLSLVFPVAALSYPMVERPFLGLKDRFGHRSRSRVHYATERQLGLERLEETRTEQAAGGCS